MSFRLFCLVVALVFSLDCAITVFFHDSLAGMSIWEAAILDAMLLAGVLSSVAYIVVLRPLVREALLWREAESNVKAERAELALLLEEGRRALQRSEGQYKQLVDCAEVIILRWNTAGTITFINEFGERFFGYPAGAIIGKGVLETIVPPEESFTGRDLEAMITRLASNPADHSRNENENIRADGTRAWISWTNTALYDVSGNASEVLSVGIDVTRRRHFEHALAQAEARSRSILESVGEGIYGVDSQGTATFCNPAAARMLGYEVGELIGQPLHPLIHHSHADGSHYPMEDCPIYRAFMSGEDTESKTELFWRKDGSCFPVELTSTPIYTDGTLSGGVVTFRDVTERNRIQRELQRSEGRIRTVLETVADGILTLDVEGTITSFNGAAERIFGYSRAEVLGKDLGLLMVDGLRDMHTNALPSDLDFCENKIPGAAREVLARRRSGEVFPIDISLAETCLSEGRIFTGVIRDITERKRAEELLRKLSRAVESSPVSVVVTNLAGEIEYVNPKFQETTGYSRAEILGNNPRLLKSGLLDSKFYAAMWEVLARGEEWHGEFHNRRKDGTYFWERASISPVRGEDGRVTHYVAVKEDITDQRRIAEQLKEAKEEAEAANLAKSTFLANMSHEIRTPLNAIFGYGQLLGRMPLEEKQREYLSTILRSSDHLLAIINDILDLARIESGRTTLALGNIDLNQLLRDMGNMFMLRSQEKGLVFEVNQLDEAHRYLRLDEGRLRQILVNLLGNATKFTESGKVVVRPRIFLEGVLPQRLEIVVEDTGPGISENEIGDLFDAFVQTASGRALQGGTGLGLAISRKLALAMGGELTARSVLGRGSTFTLTVPVAPPAGSVPGTDRRAAKSLRLAEDEPQYRILVADDVNENRQLVVELLVPLGFEVFEAQNGEEVLRQYHTLTPHLILMDLGMPVMDGYEATRLIKATAAGRATPVIALTARVLSDNRDDVIAAGVDDFLAKPFHFDELIQILQKWLNAKFDVGDLGDAAGDMARSLSPPQWAKSLTGLPAALRGELKLAVGGGRIKKIGEIVDDVSATDIALAGKLRALANNFEYRKLLDLLEEAELSG